MSNYNFDIQVIYKSGSLIFKRAVADIDSISFSLSEQNTVTDIDGNIYNIVDIGSQTWFAENLRTSQYTDNTPIPLVTETTARNFLPGKNMSTSIRSPFSMHTKSANCDLSL